MNNFRLIIYLLLDGKVPIKLKLWCIAIPVIYSFMPWDWIPDGIVNWLCVPIGWIDDLIIIILCAKTFIHLCPIDRVSFHRQKISSSIDQNIDVDFRHPTEISALLFSVSLLAFIGFLVGFTLSFFVAIAVPVFSSFVFIYIILLGFAQLHKWKADDENIKQLKKQNNNVNLAKMLGRSLTILDSITKELNKSYGMETNKKPILLIDTYSEAYQAEAIKSGSDIYIAISADCFPIDNINDDNDLYHLAPPIAHEVGHILSEHLIILDSYMGICFSENPMAKPIELFFRPWRHAAELSADRVMLLGCDLNIEEIAQYFANGKAGKQTLEAYQKQAGFKIPLGREGEVLLQLALKIKPVPTVQKIKNMFGEIHPDPLIRLQELYSWAKEAKDYQLITDD